MRCIHFLIQARMYLRIEVCVWRDAKGNAARLTAGFCSWRAYLDLKMLRGCMQRMRPTSFIRTALVEHNPTVEPSSLWVEISNAHQWRSLQLMDCAGSELLFWSPWRRGSQGSHHCHQAVCQAKAWTSFRCLIRLIRLIRLKCEGVKMYDMYEGFPSRMFWLTLWGVAIRRWCPSWLVLSQILNSESVWLQLMRFVRWHLSFAGDGSRLKDQQDIYGHLWTSIDI